MIFSSYVFIFCFLPIVLIGYFSLSGVKNKIFQQGFLVIASLVFYGWFNISYLWIIISSIIVNYILAGAMHRYRSFKKLFFYLGIIFNVGLLGYFKYYDFFIYNINSAFKTAFMLKHILLPLGISFFTFQQFSYLLSFYKGDEEKSRNIVEYSLFVVFFPQLVAGPIVNYGEMINQFRDDGVRKINYDNMLRGLYLFSMGLFKKLVISDTVSVFADYGYGMEAYTMATAWATSLLYTMQIYFDFCGYSDMAIGLAKMFNIDIINNFDSPYKSASVREFWKRWHISLGRALGSFVYIPLGGNRKGRIRTYINNFATFMISGLWHGASWTFVVWGAMHGMAVVFERFYNDFIKIKIPKFIKHLLLFLFINATWVLFRAETFSKAKDIYAGMLDFSNIGIQNLSRLTLSFLWPLSGTAGAVFIIFIIIATLIIVMAFKNSVYRYKNFKASKFELAQTVIFFVIAVIHLNKVSPFIYFNF